MKKYTDKFGPNSSIELEYKANTKTNSVQSLEHEPEEKVTAIPNFFNAS